MTVHVQPTIAASNVDTAEIDRIEKWMQKVAKPRLTPEEYRAQQVSWIVGMMPSSSTMTRGEIEEMLNEQYGRLQS